LQFISNNLRIFIIENSESYKRTVIIDSQPSDPVPPDTYRHYCKGRSVKLHVVASVISTTRLTLRNHSNFQTKSMNRTDKQDCHAYEECLFYTKSNLYIILRESEDTWTASEERAVLYCIILLYMSRRKSKCKIKKI